MHVVPKKPQIDITDAMKTFKRGVTAGEKIAEQLERLNNTLDKVVKSTSKKSWPLPGTEKV